MNCVLAIKSEPSQPIDAGWTLAEAFTMAVGNESGCAGDKAESKEDEADTTHRESEHATGEPETLPLADCASKPRSRRKMTER